jgi:serine/threonine protein kinase
VTESAAALASSVIAELAAGRIDAQRAAAALRGRLAEGQLPPEAVAAAVRAETAKRGIDPAVAEALLAQLAVSETRTKAPATAARIEAPAVAARTDAPATAARARDTPTLLRRPADAPTIPTRRADETRGSWQAARTEFHEGSLIKGRFELKALVGRGGMGMVFRALDLRKVEARDPKPEVAVKILNASFEQHPDAFVALQREASKAQTLAHPNIVTVFDFDRDGESVFITMELLRGQSLDEVVHAVRRRGMERAAALPVIRGIAEGLAYAHRKGIVHSDLKPANVFLTADKTPKILDFGIARAVPSAADLEPKDAFDAGSLGAYTEAYATEEMVEGKDPAPADDMYAFGIIVYELLAGVHPFADKSAAQARAAGLMPAPIRSLRRREWRTLARTLAFDRAKRPRDAAEFLRVFFGATRLRNALIGAVGVLAILSGLLWYRTYQQSGPAVPFEQLPPPIQQKITADFSDGDKAWNFYTQQGIPNALADSLSYYADAYRLHKGNRDAVRGLKRAADEMLKRVRTDPAALHETARSLAETSEYLKTYPPVVDAQ